MGLFPLAAEKAQTQVCSPPQLMHVLNWRQTLRVWCWLWFHLFLPLCSSAFLIYFTFILLHYMHPWSYPKSSFEAKWSRNKLKKKKDFLKTLVSFQFSSFTESCPTLCDPMDCSTPGFPLHSNSCPLSQWCHPTISSSVVPFSSRLQSFPASGSLQMSRFFASGAQNIGASVSASVLPRNIQDWFPLEWAAWISLKSKGLSRVFSNPTVQKHQFGAQLSLQSQLSHPYMTTGKTIAWTRQTFVGKVMSRFWICYLGWS